LQAFQQRLSAKIQAAQAQSSMELLRLHVRVQGRSLLLALPETNQVIEPSALTHIPLTKPWFSGLTSVRGELTSVVDLGLWLGWGAVQPSASQRWVVLAASLGAPCAIAVDAVLGLVNVNAGAWTLMQASDDAVQAALPWLSYERSMGAGSPCWGDVFQQSAQGGLVLACDFSVSKLSQLSAFVNTERK
jgi:twitching motility protein PilI